MIHPFWEKNHITLYHGDLRDVLPQISENSVDCVCTDAPYGLSFMRMDWDRQVPGPEYWQAVLRVAKPGAMLLAFGGTRTYHRLACAIEDAGWTMRDCLMWVYASGVPKGLDISKAIALAAGTERTIVGVKNNADLGAKRDPSKHKGFPKPSAIGKRGTSRGLPPAALAEAWEGWGTTLKPAYEPILLAMKPLDGTFAENAARHGVAGINIDACRIPKQEGERMKFSLNGIPPRPATSTASSAACIGTTALGPVSPPI